MIDIRGRPNAKERDGDRVSEKRVKTIWKMPTDGFITFYSALTTLPIH